MTRELPQELGWKEVYQEKIVTTSYKTFQRLKNGGTRRAIQLNQTLSPKAKTYILFSALKSVIFPKYKAKSQTKQLHKILHLL